MNTETGALSDIHGVIAGGPPQLTGLRAAVDAMLQQSAFVIIEAAKMIEENDRLRAQLATLEKEAANYRSTMVAASDEIWEHWEHHCDAEGYGPANLMRRLENGIPAGYSPRRSDYATVADMRANAAKLADGLRSIAGLAREAHDYGAQFRDSAIACPALQEIARVVAELAPLPAVTGEGG